MHLIAPVKDALPARITKGSIACPITGYATVFAAVSVPLALFNSARIVSEINKAATGRQRDSCSFPAKFFVLSLESVTTEPFSSLSQRNDRSIQLRVRCSIGSTDPIDPPGIEAALDPLKRYVPPFPIREREKRETA